MSYRDVMNLPTQKFELFNDIMQFEDKFEQKELKRQQELAKKKWLKQYL